jgi:hypothetical protein
MFKDELISSIGAYWAMQDIDDLPARLAMNRRSSRDPLVQASVGLCVSGEPGFTSLALSGQSEQFILERLGAYLVRDRVEAGLLAYVAADRDALSRLAQAAPRPDEWLVAAWLRIDRFNLDHPVAGRVRSSW